MKCPYCGSEENKVLDKRETTGLAVTRRRRECEGCGKRFTTYEKIETLDLTVVKKDGRRESYDQDKLRNSIIKACEKTPVSRGQIDKLIQDLEADLRKSEANEVTTERIGELVIGRLKDVNKVAYIRFASIYKEFRDITEFESELKRLTEERVKAGKKSLVRKVRKRDGGVVPFDQEKIVDAIWKAAEAVGGKDRGMAENLSYKVVESLEGKFGETGIPTVEDVQDAVEKMLIENGHATTAKAFILYRKQRETLRETRNVMVDVGETISSYIDQMDWRVKENSNEQYSFSGLLLYAAGRVMANYNLTQMYNPTIADAHKKGYLHLHDLSHGVIGYSFYRNEAVVVRHKKTGAVLVPSLEQLFKLVNSTVETENGFDIKHTGDYEVLDEGGWTDMERVLRHKSDKPLMSFNTFNGHNLIVTPDHPFITLGESRNVACPGCGSVEIRKTRSARICKDSIKDYYRCKSCASAFSAPVLRPDLKKRQEKRADQMLMSNYAITPSFEIETGQMAGLRPVDGWFAGLFIAEGYYKKGYLSFEMAADDPVFRKLLSYLEGSGFRHNMSQRSAATGIQHIHGRMTVDVPLSSLPAALQSLFATIRPYAENKNLPIEFMNYEPGLVGGMVAGVVDGDGAVRNDDPWVSRVSLRMTSKTLLSQMQFWFSSQRIGSSLSTIDSYGERQYQGTTITPRKQLYSLSFFLPKEKSRLLSECLKIDGSFKHSREAGKGECSGLRKIEWMRNDSEYVYDITTASHTFLCNGMLAHNCAGWSLKNLLLMGFGGVPGKVDCKPAKHLSTVVHQMVNYIGCLQMEFAGAQAFSSVDTLLAPFIKADGLTFREVKQNMQQLVFSLNIPSRWGSQYPFSNLTFDWMVPEDMKDEPAIVGGRPQDFTYGACQKEADMVNRAFLEVMIEGDAMGRIFSFPIPTYNVTKDFEWDSENAKLLFEMTAKYGTPYFQNYVGSDLDPKSIRAMCCRLNIDQKELMNRPGNMWGPGDNTGSIGVVTINMNRLGYEAKTEQEFFEKLEYYMKLARDALEVKRRVVNKNLENGLMPYTRTYLGTFNNHFSTIGLVGMNEACMNFLHKDISTAEGKEFTIRTLNFMRDRIRDFQSQSGNLYNLEATPAESTSYRLARLDKKMHPDIITSGEAEPFLTNSTQLPVNHTDDLVEALEHQNDIQPLYTGGTIFHTFLGERLQDWESARELVKKIAHNTRLPYFSITPTFSVCKSHGYMAGEVKECPTCGQASEVFSRIVGYFRPIANWNAGKQEEWKFRKTFSAETAKPLEVPAKAR
jgi:anaerobic ribonucleoside-triphosphate reductase/transcriptional regulator NrdR